MPVLRITMLLASLTLGCHEVAGPGINPHHSIASLGEEAASVAEKPAYNFDVHKRKFRIENSEMTADIRASWENLSFRSGSGSQHENYIGIKAVGGSVEELVKLDPKRDQRSEDFLIKSIPVENYNLDSSFRLVIFRYLDKSMMKIDVLAISSTFRFVLPPRP